MAVSSVVAAADALLASQYNNLRTDVLNNSTGHKHTGSSNEGRKVTFSDLDGQLVIDKTADQSITSDNSMNNDTHLVLAIPASETWLYEVTFIYLATSTPDIKVGCTVPSGATGTLSVMFDNSSGAAGLLTTTNLTTGVSLVGNGSLQAVAKLYFHIINSTNAGNVQFQWAQNTSDAFNTIVYAGSRMIGRKLA